MKRRPGEPATVRASASAGSPGRTPQRPMPMSTSTSTRSSTPAAVAAAERSATLPASSTATMTSARRRSSMRRAILIGPTIWLAIRMSVTPPSASTSASPSLAQVMPTAPAASCRRAMWTHLLDLKCGRRRTGASRKRSAILAMLRSSRARRSRSAGVSISESGAVGGGTWAGTATSRGGRCRRAAPGDSSRRGRGGERRLAQSGSCDTPTVDGPGRVGSRAAPGRIVRRRSGG